MYLHRRRDCVGGGIGVTFGTSKISVTFNCQWKQLLGNYNWRNWDIISFTFEDDIMLGDYEFHMGLLGFTATVRWNHTDTGELENIKRQAEEFFEMMGGDND